MAEQTLPPEIVAYLQSQSEGRVETANDAMKQLTDRERHILREAAVMGWVRGAMAAGGGRGAIPKDIAILVEVINCCRSNSDLYPKIAAAANGDLGPDWSDLREMARNAGYQIRRTTKGGGIRSDMRGCIRHASHWEIEPAVVDHSIAQPVASLDLIHWWWQAEGEEQSGFVVHLNVEDRCGTEAHVESASPAQALTAARLVGLIGGGDA